MSVNDVVGPYLQKYANITDPRQSLCFRRPAVSLTSCVYWAAFSCRTSRKARRRQRADGQHGTGRIQSGNRAEVERFLWPGVRKQKERDGVGKALSPDEEARLMVALTDTTAMWPNRSQTPAAIVRIALLTGLRSGEIKGLTWGQIDLEARVLTVGEAKTKAGTGRQIPMNRDLFEVLTDHADWFTARFGEARP